jgi:hypothetical protein
MANEQLERQVIELVATDRIYIPVSSMAGKLERRRPKLAKEVAETEEFSGDFHGERTYARVETDDKMKARGMKEGIEKFSKEFPKYGKILTGLIEEQRALRETHLSFGLYNGCKLTADDYMDVMANLGFTQAEAKNLYPSLMDISRKLTKQRGGEERSVMVG